MHAQKATIALFQQTQLATRTTPKKAITQFETTSKGTVELRAIDIAAVAAHR